MIRLIALAALFFLISACQTTPVRSSDPTARPAVTRSLETAGGPPPPTPSSLQRTDSNVGNRFLGHLKNRRAGLWLRVADVGQGQCIVGVTDNGYSFLIDAGHWTNRNCAAAVDQLLPNGGGLSLVILTHSDSDHLGNLSEILERDVDTILWTGRVPVKCRRGGTDCPGTYTKAASAIGKATTEGATVINLKTTPLHSGQAFTLGDVEITFLAGWNDFPDADGLDDSERENAVSIMSRISYGGHSILVTGDAIGRKRDSHDLNCIGSENWAVQNVTPFLLDADVLLASHHGADNGSASCFIASVTPEYVIFSAGGGHNHPRHSAAERFIRHGVDPNKMLRTDRGSNSELQEWDDHITSRCGDEAGDDDIDILVTAGQKLDIGYIQQDDCPPY